MLTRGRPRTTHHSQRTDGWNGERENNPNIRNCSKSNHEPDKSRHSCGGLDSTVFDLHHKKSHSFFFAQNFEFSTELEWDTISLSELSRYCRWVFCHRNFRWLTSILEHVSFYFLSTKRYNRTAWRQKNTRKLNFKDAKECVISPLSSLRFIKVGGSTTTHTHIEPIGTEKQYFLSMRKHAMIYTSRLV